MVYRSGTFLKVLFPWMVFVARVSITRLSTDQGACICKIVILTQIVVWVVLPPFDTG